MRILFAGSPGIAVPALEALACDKGENFSLVGLLTKADSPRGRSGRLEPTECAAAVRNFPIPVLKPEKLDDKARAQVAALAPGLLVSFAYGAFFGPEFLALFPQGGINVHPSLLPKYRGPSPIAAAIINRDAETGITIQRLTAPMDSGDILAQEAVPLGRRETTASLSETMARRAAALLPTVLQSLATGAMEARPQDHGAATYCSYIAKEDGIIHWGRSAADIEARIRAFDPWPLCWTMHGDLQLFILEAEALEEGAWPGGQAAACGQVLGKDRNKGILIQTGGGILAASKLQYRSKKALEWEAFLNGARNFIGSRLG